MSYKLEKPYTLQERADFIALYNHQMKLRIEETQGGLYALENNEIIKNNEAIINPNFEQEQELAQKEKVGEIFVTKREFAIELQELNVSYQDLKDLISSNEQAELEWELCTILERKNPMIDLMGAQLGLTSDIIDEIFIKIDNAKYA